MKVVSALIIGLCAIVAASLLSQGLMGLRTADRYVTVKGMAEREVQADLALWPIRFVATGSTLDEAQNKARSSREAIMAFLKLQAIDQSAVELQRLDVTDTRANPYAGNNSEQQYIINQTLMVRSTDIDRIRQAAQNVSELVDSRSVVLRLRPERPHLPVQRPERYQTGHDRRGHHGGPVNPPNSSLGMAEAKLGSLRRANQGVFQILARDQAPGVSEQQQPVKTVRVVSTFDYYLE